MLDPSGQGIREILRGRLKSKLLFWGSLLVQGIIFAFVLVVLLALAVIGLGLGELFGLSDYQIKVMTFGLVLIGVFGLVGLAWWFVLAGKDGLLG